LLLADVFEDFRRSALKYYKLDPCWYYTLPGSAWDACLKITGIELELLTDINMLLLIEQSIRGGMSMISHRYAKANNKNMKDYDETKPSSYIEYSDANNQYGWAMSQALPTGNFKWMNEQELSDWRSHPCTLEVDLEYPNEMHNLHNDYPLAPEKLKKGKFKKLVATLNNKTKYILHHTTLKLYLSLGLKLTKIHRGIKYSESNWLADYINLNIELRAKINLESEKSYLN